MTAYFNECDPFAAQWLRNLISAGHIVPGDVDEHSITAVRAADLRGYDQCHFFAGIGTWSHALRRAEWTDDRRVWTGSCPCQGFSVAGKGLGFDDERHLWPAWFSLIRECRPDVVFGEQVASNLALAWLDLVHADMDGAGYTIGALDVCAASVGAPHIRQRIYFVGVAVEPRLERHTRDGDDSDESRRLRTAQDRSATATSSAGSNADTERAGGPVNGFWRDAEWIACRDGKARPVESGVFPLAHGITARVGRLRAYGNALVAPQATEFIRAYMSIA